MTLNVKTKFNTKIKLKQNEMNSKTNSKFFFCIKIFSTSVVKMKL